MIGTKLTYDQAGVSIETGNELVERIKPLVAKTRRPECMGGLGGFGALFELPLDRYKHPILVSSTDGVGTKLKLAIELNQHGGIGIDLVAMCVNDILVQGAEPLYFLDYFATSKLQLDRAQTIIQGIVQGCCESNVALIGGETAEMPGMYQSNDYDLAGFVVGIVEKEKLITGALVTPGDILIALPSSGLHSNGFSLVRKIVEEGQHNLQSPFGLSTLGNTLLTPTKIYVKSILTLLQSIPVKALAHITGGGLIENLPRVLPNFTMATLNKESWTIPEIFNWLQQQGNIDPQEMLRTFNCGVGMVICVCPEDAKKTIDILEQLHEQPWEIGVIERSSQQTPRVNWK